MTTEMIESLQIFSKMLGLIERDLRLIAQRFKENSEEKLLVEQSILQIMTISGAKILRDNDNLLKNFREKSIINTTIH